MLNVVILMGRVSKTPQLRKSGETSIANFDIAVDNKIKKEDGSRGTTFISVVCFNNIAESVTKHLDKGSRVAVHGSLNQRSYLRNDGSKANVYEVLADSVEFLDPKPKVEEDEDGAMDSTGSLDGEKYVDENGNEQELHAVPPEPKFDPMTGKPLKPKAKK